jgi:hypothetical protein
MNEQRMRFNMRVYTALFLLGIIPLLESCASHPITLAPVGPNPYAGGTSDVGTGQLQVFSSLAEQSDNQNQGSKDAVWYQHTDYNVYDARGKLVKHVDNTVGHYEKAPRLVSLPAGQYIVSAQSRDALSVKIPVVIERGRTTKVHLDENWRLPPSTPNTEVVSAPGGYPVGWRADLPGK